LRLMFITFPGTMQSIFVQLLILQTEMAGAECGSLWVCSTLTRIFFTKTDNHATVLCSKPPRAVRTSPQLNFLVTLGKLINRRMNPRLLEAEQPEIHAQVT
jgi:hypothetical protein